MHRQHKDSGPLVWQSDMYYSTAAELVRNTKQACWAQHYIEVFHVFPVSRIKWFGDKLVELAQNNHFWRMIWDHTICSLFERMEVWNTDVMVISWKPASMSHWGHGRMVQEPWAEEMRGSLHCYWLCTLYLLLHCMIGVGEQCFKIMQLGPQFRTSISTNGLHDF